LRLRPSVSISISISISIHTKVRRIFITVQKCSTFSRNPIDMRVLEEFDDQIKLQRPD
jgi:hypothetical protein